MLKRAIKRLLGEPHPHTMSIFLVVMCAQLFVLGPLSREIGPLASYLDGMVSSAWLIIGVLALSPTGRTQLFTAAMVLVAVLLRWLSVYQSALPFQVADRLAVVVGSMVLVVLVWRQIAGDHPATAHKIRGAIAAYLLVASAFGALHNMIEIALPGSYRPASVEALLSPRDRDTFLYFSFTTLTTLGFGDITPVHPIARSMAMLEAAFGMLYPPTIIGILVNLHSERLKGQRDSARLRRTDVPEV